MNFKLELVLLVCCVVQSISAQNPTIASTDAEEQKLLKKLSEYEIRINTEIGKLIPMVNSSIDDLKANQNVIPLVTALQNLRNYLVDLSMISRYAPNDALLSCSNIVLRLANIKYIIENYDKVKSDVDGNEALLFTYLTNLHGADVANYYLLKSKQGQNINVIMVSVMNLDGLYIQLSAEIRKAKDKYNKLLNDLIYCKNNYCVCAKKLSNDATSTLAKTDDNIKQVQVDIDVVQANIKNISLDVTNKINLINPDLKKDTSMIPLTSVFDVILALMKGCLKKMTSDMIKVTTTCDEAAMKDAFIRHRIDEYFQTFEWAKQLSQAILEEINDINSAYMANGKRLTSTQKTTAQAAIQSLNNIQSQFTQFVFVLDMSKVKLEEYLVDAREAWTKSCNCTSNGSVTRAPASSPGTPAGPPATPVGPPGVSTTANPSVNPKSGHCPSSQQADITTSSGKYVKTACVIRSGSNHSGDYIKCKENGMKLFVINSTSTQQQVFSFLEKHFGTAKGPTLWIDGVKDTDGNWYYYSHGSKSPAFEGLLWNTNARESNGCMIATPINSKWKIDGRSCSIVSYPVCEFIK